MNEKQEKNPLKIIEKKKKFFLVKLIISISIIFFSYFVLKYWQIRNENNKINIKENSDESLFDLSDEYKLQQDEISELQTNEIREKGADFIYKLLIKNQMQISELKTEIQGLKDEINKYRHQEKISKMIVVYFNLREDLKGNKNYNNNMQSFELLSSNDKNLEIKIEKLKSIAPHLLTKEKIAKSFQNLIPDLIMVKPEEEQNNGFFSKIILSIKKLVIIRKIDSDSLGNIDGIIVKIEKLIEEENYQEAMTLCLSMHSSYHEIIKNFLENLSIATEFSKIDQEILDYLKNLT